MKKWGPKTLTAGLPFPEGVQPDEQAWLNAHAAVWEAEQEQAMVVLRAYNVARFELRTAEERIRVLEMENDALRKRVGHLVTGLRKITMGYSFIAEPGALVREIVAIAQKTLEQYAPCRIPKWSKP